MNKNHLSSFQLFSLLAMSSMLGLHATSPYGLTAGYFLAAIALFTLQGLSLFLLCRSFSLSGAENAEALVHRFFAPLPGRILMLFFGILLLIRSSITLSAQTDCTALYLLEDTPNIAVMIILLVSSFFALLPGLRKLSGVSTLLFFILSAFLLLIIIPGLAGADLGELRTLIQPLHGEFPAVVIPAAITVSGAECAVFFIPTVKKRGRLLSAAAAPAVCAILFCAMSCVTAGTIGPGGMKEEMFPLVEGARQIKLGGIELTERFDLPLITVTLLASLVQIAIYSICAVHAFCTAFSCSSAGTVSMILLPAQLIIALAIQYTSLDSLFSAVCAVGLTCFSLIIFPLMSIILLIHRKGNRRT